MDWATIRVPVSREFLMEAEPDAGDEQRMVLHPRLMGRYPLRLGEHDLGQWDVVGIEATMQPRTQEAFGDHRPSHVTAEPLMVLPTYWAILSRAVPSREGS